MSVFLYYFPEKPDNFDPREKLAYAFEQRPMGRRVIDKGPDGGSGAIFCAGSDLSKLGNYPDRQQWTEVPFLGCWVGQYRDDPPREEFLRRRQMLAGKTISLAGQEWTVPMARSFHQLPDGKFTAVSNLASYLKVDYASGDWVPGGVAREYEPLWNLAMRYWEIWWRHNVGESDDAELTEDMIDQPLEIAPHEIEKMAVDALATNYRISKVEVSLMDLLCTDDCFKVLNAVIDLDSFFEIIKKNVSPPEGSSTGNGKPAVFQTTPQLSPIG